MAARRRAYGEGAISKRTDGRWVGIAELGWQDGKRRRKYVYGTTRAEVAAKLAKVRSDQQSGQLVEDERIKAGVSPTTVLQLHRLLHHALRDAVRWSLVPAMSPSWSRRLAGHATTSACSPPIRRERSCKP